MPATTSRKIQSRVPIDIQAAADTVIKAAGLTVSDVVRVLMTRIAKDKAIPPALFQPQTEILPAREDEGEDSKMSAIQARQYFRNLSLDNEVAEPVSIEEMNLVIGECYAQAGLRGLK